MRPTTQRGNLKVKRSGNTLSPKSAQSFKQGAQNQTTNATNARLRGAANTFKNEKVKVDPNAFNDVFNSTSNKPPKTPKVPKGNRGGFADDAFKGFSNNATKKVGRSMLRKKLLVGAGLAGGLYAAKKLGEKRRQSKQNPGLLSKLTKDRVSIK